MLCITRARAVAPRVRIVKNELGGSATQQELRSWGSQWTEQGNWGVKPPTPPSIRALVAPTVLLPHLHSVGTPFVPQRGCMVVLFWQQSVNVVNL